MEEGDDEREDSLSSISPSEKLGCLLSKATWSLIRDPTFGGRALPTAVIHELLVFVWVPGHFFDMIPTVRVIILSTICVHNATQRKI